METKAHMSGLGRLARRLGRARHTLWLLASVVTVLAMGGFSPARASSLSVLATFMRPASYVYAAEPQTGIDCGCDAVGEYVTPVAPDPLSIQPTTSPNDKYQVVTHYGSGQITYLGVIRTSDSREIVSLGALPNSTYWSFSPDDDRFAIYSIRQTSSGSQTTYYLYNLVRATNPGSPVWDTTTLLVDTEAAFSPHGQYFQYAVADNATTWLTIRDARTGARVYETNFKAAAPPGGKKVRVASWGYSPDTSDRTFVYAYVSSQTVSSVFWGVVNLQRTPNKLVRSELLVNAIANQTIRPFWKFSPCGDAIGLVNTAVTPRNIRLFATSDGALKGELNITTSGTVTLKTDSTRHFVEESPTYTLAVNTAAAACTVVPVPPELTALSISPASVVAGSTTARGTVTLSQPAPSGGVVVSLWSSVPSTAQVPSSVRVLAGDSSAEFTITTYAVSAETTATISASLGSTTKTATLAISPSPFTLTMSHYGIIAGAIEIGTVTLRDPAPAGGAMIYLYAGPYLSAPPLVQVPPGETSATFNVMAHLLVESPKTKLEAWYLGASQTIDLMVLRASSLAVTPNPATGGIDEINIAVNLDTPAPAGGIVVPLRAIPADIVNLPSSATIESGQTNASVWVSTVAIDEDTDVTIVAGMPEDSESPTAVVHVLAIIPTALPGGPYVVLAGQPITLAGTGTDPRGESLTFAWDLDGDEMFETAGDTTDFTNTAGHNREIPVWFSACNTSGLCGTALTFVRVRNPGQVWISGPEPSQDIGMPNDEIGIPDGPTPALVEGFGQVIDVVGGADFVAALQADGTVWTMGDNFYGQLGNPDPTLPTGWLPDGHRAASNVPVQADISDVVAIASRGEHMMALKQDRTVWTWGSNNSLELGNGTADGNPHPTPTQVEGLSEVVAIAASRHSSFALTSKGEIYGWGYGDTKFGRTDDPYPCKITRIDQAVAFQVTSSWVIVLKRDGTVWFWGGYDPVTMEDRLDPEQIEGFSGITRISAVGEHGSIISANDALLALKNDGTVWGFGNNDYGQLGHDPFIPYPPYPDDNYIGPVQIPGLAGIQAIAAGEALQAALLQDGTVAGWGLVVLNCPAGCGEYWLPSPLAGLANVKAVAVGDDFRLAIVPGGVPGAPDLAITQVADQETVSTGDPVGFTITITNNGDGTANSVTLSDTLPTAAELSWLVSGTDAASCTITSGVVSCDFGDMPPGVVKTIRLTSPTQNIWGKGFCPIISSTATVIASNQPEGKSATASTEVLCPFVGISVWTDTPSVAAGDPISLTVTFGNIGQGIARGVVAEGWLPNNPGLGWSISNVVPASATSSCGLSSGSDLRCDFPELAPGQEVTITVTSPTTSGSCGTLAFAGGVTCTNGGGSRAKTAIITVNCTVGATVQPGEAATLKLPDGRGQIEFPAGLVTVPTTFTYTEQDAPSQALGSYTFAGLSFTLDATDPAGNPVTSFPASYTIRLTYQDSDWQSAGIADESLLNLAYWDTATGQWVNVLPCEGCSLDMEQNHLVAMLNHLTEFALLASTDATPPTTSASLTPQASASGWHAGPVTVALTASDSGSGVHSTEYNLNGAGWTTYSAPFEVSSESASNTVQYRSTDEAGNVEDTQSLTIRIDTAPPTTSVSLSPEAGASGWHAGPVTVALTASDSGSGVHSTEYNLNGAGWTTYSARFEVSSESANNTVQYRSTDEAGNVEDTQSLTIRIDTAPPATSASLSPEAGASGWHTGPVMVTLTASDSDSGVHNTEYNLNGAGWTTYSAPFVVSSESTSNTAHNTVQYRSTDEAGNVEETKSLTIQIDTTAPTVGASVPLSGSAVQGGIKFGVTLADTLSGPAGALLSIREADGASGKVIGYENLAAVYNSTSGSWELAQPFDTTQLPDGFYVLVATGKDVAGNEKTEIIPFSVRNWAVLELLPSTENNKAGRTMPVKFSLRVVQEVDPAQPFVYSEELTVAIYEAGKPTPVLQRSTFGSGARDYRINALAQTYITNFKTLKQPMQYTVEILRGALSIGTFGFQTTK